MCGLFYHYLFFISPSFVALGRLCVLIWNFLGIVTSIFHTFFSAYFPFSEKGSPLIGKNVLLRKQNLI